MAKYAKKLWDNLETEYSEVIYFIEDIIFCFYLISYFRFMIQRRNLLIDTGEDKKSYYI